MIVRHPLPLEPLPPTLPHKLGYMFLSPQPDWVWLVFENDNKTPLALLMAAPAQHIVFLMRIAAATQDSSVSAGALRLLLRTALNDMKARGYLAYCVCCDPNQPLEAKLLKLVQQTARGLESTPNMTLAIGSTVLEAS